MIKELQIRTPSHACFVDITSEVGRFVGQSGVNEGICCLYVPHTTAGLTINENADPTVQSDILRQLDKFVPWDDHYAHSEGNAAAHIKSSLLGSSLMILIESGRLRLGTWQGIFLAEFDGPRTRQVWVKTLAG